MKKQYLQKILRTELDALNAVIDQKIQRGQSYRREAIQHRFLMSRLQSVRRESQRSFFGRLTAVPTFFL